MKDIIKISSGFLSHRSKQTIYFCVGMFFPDQKIMTRLNDINYVLFLSTGAARQTYR